MCIFRKWVHRTCPHDYEKQMLGKKEKEGKFGVGKHLVQKREEV